jgi:hypothetical protein
MSGGDSGQFRKMRVLKRSNYRTIDAKNLRSLKLKSLDTTFQIHTIRLVYLSFDSF